MSDEFNQDEQIDLLEAALDVIHTQFRNLTEKLTHDYKNKYPSEIETDIAVTGQTIMAEIQKMIESAKKRKGL